jgi:hypothetical protein
VNPIEALQHLEQSGLPAQQARAIANVIEQRREQLVTSLELKSELSGVETRLSDKIRAIEKQLTDKIHEVKTQLGNRMLLIGLPLLLVGPITWVLQLFNTELRQFFNAFFHH